MSLQEESKSAVKEVFAAANQRLKHPFFGTYILAFIPSNWKFLLFMVLSDLPIAERIKQSEGYYNWMTIFLFPFLISILYTIGHHFIMWFIENLVKTATSGRKKTMQVLLNEDWDDRIDIAKKEYEYEQARAGAASTKTLNDEIENLKKQLSDSNKQVDKFTKSYQDKSSELNTANDQVVRHAETIERHVNKIKELESHLSEIASKPIIVNAIWASVNESLNVTNAIRFYVVRDEAVSVNNETFGKDPDPGFLKQLKIEYYTATDKNVKTVVLKEGQIFNPRRNLK